MPTISTLTVRLSANSAKLVAEFKKAQRRADTFGSRMKGVARTASRAFVGLAATAVPALVALGVAGVQAADNLAKTAAKLGISADQLAGLRFAAEQTGVGLRTLDLGLQRMVRRVAEAAKGTGEAQKALKELGLDARSLAAQSPDEQFRRIADAMQDVGSQSDKVRLGFKLFDSEGVGLVNTLESGRQELDKFTEEARRLGLTLTGRQLENVQKAADAQNRVSKAFAGLGRQLGATLAPAITSAATAVVNIVARVTEAVPKFAAWSASIFGVRRELESLAVVDINEELRILDKQILEATGLWKSQRNELAKYTDEQGNVSARAADLVANFEIQGAKVKDLNDRYNDLIRTRLRLKKQGESTGSAFIAITPSSEQRQALAEVQDRWRTIAEDFNAFVNQQDRLASSGANIFQQTREPLEIYIAKIKEAKEALEGGFLPGGQNTFDRYNKQLLNDLIPNIDKVKKKTDELKFNFDSAFEDAIIEGKKFREVLEGVYKDILRIFVRKSISEPFGNFLSSAFSGLFGGGKALGGPVAAGVPYMVGERGSELFVPQQNGTIIPNNQLSGGGGVTLIQHIDASNSVDPVQTAAMVETAAETGANRALDKIAALRRKGRF